MVKSIGTFNKGGLILTLNSMMFFTVFFTFFPLYYLSKKYKWILLLLFNYYFYILAMPRHVLTILVTSIIAYICGLIIDLIKNKSYKKLSLFISISIFLGLLIYFKYSNFLLRIFKITISEDIKNLVAPIGISFYTLQIISYLVDIYRGNRLSEKHLGHFLTYVSFFGTILSGPIERSSNFLPQLKGKIKLDFDLAFEGLKKVVLGLFLKVIIADNLGTFVNTIYSNPRAYKGYPLILATFLFAIQLYTDFNGYTLMARGFSEMLGIKIMDNFNCPYFSKSTREFWRRWHISLSTWFRDYIYIPLGGNKISLTRSCINRLIVFTASGLWHGASFSFMAWGFLHGFYQSFSLIMYKLFPKRKSSPKIVKIIITFLLVDFAWIFFKASSLRDGLYICRNIPKELGISNLLNLTSFISLKDLITFFTLIIILLFLDYIKEKNFLINKFILALGYLSLLLLIFLLGNPSQSTFIYFNF